MRSLQRELRQRFPPREALRVRSQEASAPVVPARGTRWAWVVFLALMLGAGSAGAMRVWNGRIVADARLEAFRQVLRAPADVRVVELRCASGARVSAGEVLAVLAPVWGQARRRAAEVGVQRAQARLAALESGARLEGLDLSERVEGALEARREATAAAAELDVLTAEVAELEGERAALELELELAREDRRAGQASFEARSAEAASRLERERGDGEQRAFEVERLGRLAAEGLVSELVLSERRSALAASLRTQEELAAARDAVHLDQEAQRQGLERDSVRDAARLEALEARIASARARRDGALLREQEWSALSRERARLAPADGAALEELRERELELARIDLEQALAELAAAQEAGGGGELRAAFDGWVDSVEVVVGAQLESGAPLLGYHDRSTLALVAYVLPQEARRLERGARCTLVPEDGGPALEARVVEIAPRVVACPPDLWPAERETTDLRVRLRLECDAPQGLERLPLDLRFKVVFRSLSSESDGSDGP